MNIFGGGHAASDPGEIILDLEQEWKDMHMLVCNRDMCIFTGELENMLLVIASTDHKIHVL